MSKKITIKQVENVARLARLGLSEKEKGKFQTELGAILEYIDQLQKLDIWDVEPTAHVTGLENKMREDENGSTGSPQAAPEALVDMAPDKKEGYVRVKKVLNK